MAEEKSEGQEKTQPATPQRLEKLREKGQVPRSQEVSAFVSVLSVTMLLLFTSGWMSERLTGLFKRTFLTIPPHLDSAGWYWGQLSHAFTETLLTVLPVAAFAFVITLIGSYGIGGWTLNAENVLPKLSKMDPIEGFKTRVFSVNGLMQMLKALAKFLLIFATAITVLSIAWEYITNLSKTNAQSGIARGLWIGWIAMVTLAMPLLIIAIIDVPFQIWNFKRRNKMSFQDLRDEQKESEGSPELKQRVRQIQNQLSQQRMMEAVPSADVIITNPTHYAVALKYETERGSGAPVLVASGVDLVAARIRQLATTSEVPLIESPALARAVYHHTKVGQEIPAGLYQAVAVVLRYAYRLRGHPGFRDAPRPSDDLPIPEPLVVEPR